MFLPVGFVALRQPLRPRSTQREKPLSRVMLRFFRVPDIPVKAFGKRFPEIAR